MAGFSIADIQPKLPEGVEIQIQHDRSILINSTIETVKKNLFEGAILVVVVLLLLLGKAGEQINDILEMTPGAAQVEYETDGHTPQLLIDVKRDMFQR